MSLEERERMSGLCKSPRRIGEGFFSRQSELLNELQKDSRGGRHGQGHHVLHVSFSALGNSVSHSRQLGQRALAWIFAISWISTR